MTALDIGTMFWKGFTGFLFMFVVLARAVCSFVIPIGAIAALGLWCSMLGAESFELDQKLMIWGVQAFGAMGAAIILDAICKPFFRWSGED